MIIPWITTGIMIRQNINAMIVPAEAPVTAQYTSAAKTAIMEIIPIHASVRFKAIPPYCIYYSACLGK